MPVNSSHSFHGQLQFAPGEAHVVNVHKARLVRGLAFARAASLGILLSAIIISTNQIAKQSFALKAGTPTISVPQISVPVIAEEKLPTPKPKSAAATINQQDSDDLQAVLDKWQKENSGEFGVVIQELDGQKRTASLNSHTQFQAASLYKLFLAQYLYTKIDTGVLGLFDTLGSSQTIANCLQQMIIVSDNECGESIGYSIGWPTLHNFVRAQGFSETTMSPVNVTTASDLAGYLKKLETGSLIAKDYRQQLLSNMSQQVFRSGIPAGVPGVVVADKTGDKGIYTHDAAIVYHPKGTYILVILSQNSSNYALQDLSTRISDFINR